MVRWMLWTPVVVVFTLAMFPLSFIAPAAGAVAGAGLGWWAARSGLGLPGAAGAVLAGWAFLTVWHVQQHFDPQIDRDGELAGSAVFVAGAGVLVWVVAAIAKRGNRFVAAGLALAGGLAVLQASCYVLVKLSTPHILVSPWLWYFGSMFPYGRFNGDTFSGPAGGYLESDDWFRLADSLVMYPGTWTFLIAFALAHACTGVREDVVAVQAQTPAVTTLTPG